MYMAYIGMLNGNVTFIMKEIYTTHAAVYCLLLIIYALFYLPRLPLSLYLFCMAPEKQHEKQIY